MYIKKKIQQIFNLLGFRIVKANYSTEIQTLFDEKYGHKLSVESQKSINADGEPIPWFTYSAIEFLSQFDLTGKEIFEWGSGNSSLFFIKHGALVTSVESNIEWFNYVNSNKLDNHNLIHAKEGEISQVITQLDMNYDIILVDDKMRYDCTVFAINHLNKGGLIILDNSDWYPSSAAYLREKGFIQIDMHGVGPINNYTWTTSFFFKDSYSLPLAKDKQPLCSLGGINQIGTDDQLFN